MTITLTIDPTVESVGIQTIGKALRVVGTDAECRMYLANHLREITAQLYVRGDQMKRDETAASTAVAAAASKITVA
jgi:hypothetical protein